MVLLIREKVSYCLFVFLPVTGDEPSLEEWVGEMEALKYPFRPPPVDKYVAGTWERVLLLHAFL